MATTTLKTIAADGITSAKAFVLLTDTLATNGTSTSVAYGVNNASLLTVVWTDLADGMYDCIYYAGAVAISSETIVVSGATTVAVEISTVTANKIADHVRRRTQANVESSIHGDALDIKSLYGLIQQGQESNTADNAGFLTVYKTDGSTELAQLPITSSAAAELITGIS